MNKLSVYEYFEKLQIEYLICKLRERIYPYDSDKKYWSKTAEGKKVKAESISLRNQGLPTIFNDKDMENTLIKRVYTEVSPPLFFYPNEGNKEKQRYQDHLYYYNIGSDVSYNIDGETRIGKVHTYTPLSSTLGVVDRDTGTITEVESKTVIRIL